MQKTTGYNTNILRMVLGAAFLITHFSFLMSTAAAQGIPFLRNYNATEYMGHNQNFDVIAAKDGTVFVANFEGLLYYDQAQWRMIHTEGITRITSVFQDSKGTVWAGGYNYFGSVKADSRGVLQLESRHAENVIRGEVQWIWEKHGNIFFLASDKRIYAVTAKTIAHAPGEQTPPYKASPLNANLEVNQIEELDDGMVALATNGNGVVFVDAKGKEMFRVTDKNGLCSNNVAHMDYNRHGLLWGATDNGIFCIAFPSVYSHFTQNEGLHGEVLSIQRLEHQVYAGTLNGLYRLNGMSFVPVPQVSHACWQLITDHNSLLAATSNGVYRIGSNGSVSQLTTSNTMSLLVDGNNFYSGEMDGVYYNNGSHHQKLCNAERVTVITRDKQGALWLQNLYGKIWKSTDGRGFFAYQKNNKEEISTLVDFGDHIEVIPVTATKPFRYPSFSYLDPTGILWLTNNKGKNLYAYKNNAKDKDMSAAVYALMDYPVRTVMHDGELIWIGGDKGINVVYKKGTAPLKDLTPVVQIRSVMLRGDSLLWGGYGSKPNILPKLDSDDRHVIFTFSIAYPSLLLKTQYRTRLDGSAWAAWDTDSKEEYTTLAYGRHTFEVQARDAFGRMSEPVRMSLEVMYPFYLRWYMLLCYIALMALIIYLLVQLRLRQLEKDKRRLERIVKERTTEVVRLEKQASVGKLTQGLIDRILNPLNYINNFAKLSEGLVKDVKANVEDEKDHMDSENYEDTMDVLDMLKGNLEKVGEHGASTTRTLKAMEEMLKDRSGGIIPMNLTALLHQNEEMVMTYFGKEIEQYHIKSVFEIPASEIKINGNAEQLSKTFMSMLANAIYAVIKKSKRVEVYSPEISLKTVVDGKQVYLHFHDNGIGIESTILDKIFDPFFTTKTTAEASGVGLYLSREIAQNHGGDISVQSEMGVFTEFTITLPTI